MYLEFKDHLVCLELESQVRMASLDDLDFPVVKESKDYLGCQDLLVSLGLGNQVSQGLRVTEVWGVFLELLDLEERKVLQVHLGWEGPQVSQACLEFQVPWDLQVLLASQGPKEKVELWGHKGHWVPKVSQGYRVSQGNQVSSVKWDPQA